jgi:hypothetical protein
LPDVLLAELRDYVLGLDIAISSSKPAALAHNLTNLLHTALRTAELQNPAEQDKARAFGSLIAMNRKLKTVNRTLCDVVVALGKRRRDRRVRVVGRGAAVGVSQYSRGGPTGGVRPR